MQQAVPLKRVPDQLCDQMKVYSPASFRLFFLWHAYLPKMPYGNGKNYDLKVAVIQIVLAIFFLAPDLAGYCYRLLSQCNFRLLWQKVNRLKLK